MGIYKTQEKKQGYTVEDHAIRCPKCSVGKDNFGNTIGAVIAEQRVICQLESRESVLVATVGRCCKRYNEFWPDRKKMPDCNALSHFKINPDGQRLGLTQENILACCRQSGGNLFTIAELQSGQVGNNGFIPRYVEKPYNPDQYHEQNIEEVTF